MLSRVSGALYLLLAALGLPSLVALVNTLIIGVMERTREMGVLRSLGATRGQIVTLVLAEAVLLSATGTGLGIVVGLYLGRAMLPIFQASGVPADFSVSGAGQHRASAAARISRVLLASCAIIAASAPIITLTKAKPGSCIGQGRRWFPSGIDLFP